MTTLLAGMIGAGLGGTSAALVGLYRSRRIAASRITELEQELRELRTASAEMETLSQAVGKMQVDHNWLRASLDLLARLLINRLVLPPR